MFEAPSSHLHHSIEVTDPRLSVVGRSISAALQVSVPGARSHQLGGTAARSLIMTGVLLGAATRSASTVTAKMA